MKKFISFVLFLAFLASRLGSNCAAGVGELSRHDLAQWQDRDHGRQDNIVESGTIVQALAIREGKVLAGGTNQRMLALEGPDENRRPQGAHRCAGHYRYPLAFIRLRARCRGEFRGPDTNPHSGRRNVGQCQKENSRRGAPRGGEKETRRMDFTAIAQRGGGQGRQDFKWHRSFTQRAHP